MTDQVAVPKSAVRAMLVLVVAMALIAVYANVQRLRRDKIETVIVTPLHGPSPSPTPLGRSD